jgi:ABC-type multidrug transport system ATPase subunit
MTRRRPAPSLTGSCSAAAVTGCRRAYAPRSGVLPARHHAGERQPPLGRRTLGSVQRDAGYEPLLEARNLRVVLGGVAVLEGVDLALRPGDAVWLEGPNGAGKTTLLRALAGLIGSSGDVFVGGHRVGGEAARAQLRFVPDSAPLYEDLSVREHAELLGRVSGRPGADAAALDWCGRFGLDDRLDHYPSALSRGMRQKLILAVALGGAPPLLLLDEPLNALDVDAQGLLLAGLRDHAADGGAVLVSGHQADVSKRWSGRRLRLEAGRATPPAAR